MFIDSLVKEYQDKIVQLYTKLVHVLQVNKL